MGAYADRDRADPPRRGRARQRLASMLALRLTDGDAAFYSHESGIG
ncbi:MAG: hypothetical protein R2734_15605 [Nocardioides sp.]